MAFDGVQYELRTHRGAHDVFARNLDPSVPDPGGYYEAYYAHPRNPRERRGPFYVWLIDSTLVERSYRTPSGGRSYTYDAKGTLRGFHSSERGWNTWLSCDKRHGSFMKEWFGGSGQLVGLQTEDVQYWRGVERTGDDYFEIWQRWFQTLPARGRLSPPRSPSVWDSIPEEIGPLMHITAAELPPFPAGGEALHDPRRWPATWKVDGNLYKRFYVEYGDRKTREGLHHFEEIRPSFTYGAYYSPDGHRSYRVVRGPAYTWQADGKLFTREYRTNAMTRRWRHDSQGKLMAYEYRIRPESSWWSCARREAIGSIVGEEHYSGAGDLVAFESQLDRLAYWRGRKVTPFVYADSMRHWIPARDPIRWNAPHGM